MLLTDIAIRKAQPTDKPLRLFYSGGLYLEVSPTGGKWWRLKYRHAGKEKLISLGVDSDSGLVHTVVGTTAEVSDMAMFDACLHGEEVRVAADRGYDYPRLREASAERCVADYIGIKAKPERPLSARAEHMNRVIASIRAKGEHPFRVFKRQFGFAQARYRGSAKNMAQLTTLFAL